MTSTAFCSSAHRKILSGQWDELTLYQNPNASLKEVNASNQWLLDLLLDQDICSQEAYQAIQRLFGPRTPQQWSSTLTKGFLTLPAIQRFLENDSIDLHCFPSIMRYVLEHGLYNPEDKIPLLNQLIAHGADINQTDERFGTSLLLSYIYSIYLPDPRHEEHLHISEARTLIPFLLQKGADPLLSSKKGVSALDYVKKMQEHTIQEREDDEDTQIPSEFTSWLIAELEKYA